MRWPQPKNTYPEPTPISDEIGKRKGYEGERCNVTRCTSGLPAIHRHRYNKKDDGTGDAYYCEYCARSGPRSISKMCANDGFQLFDFMPPEKK